MRVHLTFVWGIFTPFLRQRCSCYLETQGAHADLNHDTYRRLTLKP